MLPRFIGENLQISDHSNRPRDFGRSEMILSPYDIGPGFGNATLASQLGSGHSALGRSGPNQGDGVFICSHSFDSPCVSISLFPRSRTSKRSQRPSILAEFPINSPIAPTKMRFVKTLSLLALASAAQAHAIDNSLIGRLISQLF